MIMELINSEISKVLKDFAGRHKDINLRFYNGKYLECNFKNDMKYLL